MARFVIGYWSECWRFSNRLFQKSISGSILRVILYDLNFLLFPVVIIFCCNYLFYIRRYNYKLPSITFCVFWRFRPHPQQCRSQRY